MAVVALIGLAISHLCTADKAVDCSPMKSRLLYFAVKIELKNAKKRYAEGRPYRMEARTKKDFDLVVELRKA